MKRIKNISVQMNVIKDINSEEWNKRYIISDERNKEYISSDE